ncbi:hypothetical protein EMPG_16615 [Blastomyces silverae]|uniref:Uncharacterized protein n=1 Tax=Blastomyces silverae TaxID=2060906 RepID=A0A0H1BA05_9EURO|nr:hypothetical protein EMPG_16615 [Blastomyces silverae]
MFWAKVIKRRRSRLNRMRNLRGREPRRRGHVRVPILLFPINLELSNRFWIWICRHGKSSLSTTSQRRFPRSHPYQKLLLSTPAQRAPRNDPPHPRRNPKRSPPPNRVRSLLFLQACLVKHTPNAKKL